MIPNIKEGSKIISDLLKWLQIPITHSTKDTPQRVAKAYIEMFSGMYQDPPKITTFVADDGYVSISDIPFNSTCEHHLLPFKGRCGIVYASKNKVIGLSKIPRIINYWSARPQLQERLTAQIADDIMERLKPHGIYVVMVGQHSCMEIRGVKSHGSVTTTDAIRGKIDLQGAMRLLQQHSYFKGQL